MKVIVVKATPGLDEAKQIRAAAGGGFDLEAEVAARKRRATAKFKGATHMLMLKRQMSHAAGPRGDQ